MDWARPRLPITYRCISTCNDSEEGIDTSNKDEPASATVVAARYSATRANPHEVEITEVLASDVMRFYSILSSFSALPTAHLEVEQEAEDEAPDVERRDDLLHTVVDDGGVEDVEPAGGEGRREGGKEESERTGSRDVTETGGSHDVAQRIRTADAGDAVECLLCAGLLLLYQEQSYVIASRGSEPKQAIPTTEKPRTHCTCAHMAAPDGLMNEDPCAAKGRNGRYGTCLAANALHSLNLLPRGQF